MQGRTGIGSDLNRWPHQYHRRASLLVCVHPRFHFLVPEQVRYRREGTIATSGGSTRRYSPPMIERSFLVRSPAALCALGAQICAPIAGSPSHGRSELNL
jgi:hypothetical protein